MNSKNRKDKVSDNPSEENIHRLQAMINEALQGKITTSTIGDDEDSGYSSAAIGPIDHKQTDQLETIMYNLEGETSNDSNLSLGKLYLKFKNLDFRLTRVEEVIMTREDLGSRKAGKKRVTTMSRSGFHSVDPGYPSQNDLESSPSSRLNDLISINPILTNSSEMLSSLNSFQTSSLYSLPSINTSIRLQGKDEIKRSELDHYCLPLLEANPKPSTELMQEIANSLSSIYPNVTQKQLLSKIREWFRKRREYMSQRIFQVCSEIYKDLTIENESDLEAVISILNQRSDIVDTVLKSADLEITNDAVARDYCYEKIISYLNSLYKPPISKNRH